MKKLFVVLAVLVLVGGSAFAQSANSSVTVNVACGISFTVTNPPSAIWLTAGQWKWVHVAGGGYFEFNMNGELGGTVVFTTGIVSNDVTKVTVSDGNWYENAGGAGGPEDLTDALAGGTLGSCDSDAYTSGTCKVWGVASGSATVTATVTVTSYTM